MEEIHEANGKVKIVVTGPESSGKSSLATWLAQQFNFPVVPEFSREYLNSLGRTYEHHDLDEIAEGQIKNENKAQKRASIIICDTSLEVIKIWSMYKYNTCSSFILEHYQNRPADLYLLMAPDIPWTPDPLRENPDDREQLFKLFQQELKTGSAKVVEIFGTFPERKEKASQAIKQLLFKD